MKYILLPIFTFIFTLGLFSQAPVLVKDINPGSIGSSLINHPSIQIGDVIYFIGDIGGKRDLYSLHNGEIELISQLCPGSCQSFKILFFEYKGKLLFKKQFNNTLNQLWETDGTEAGTKQIFEYNGTFRNIVVGNNSKIYLSLNNRATFKDEVYISDGTTAGTEKIGTDIAIFSSDKYDDGVVFSNISNDSLKVLSYNDKTLRQLSKIKVRPGSFVASLKKIGSNDVVILVHSDDASVSEVYRYNSTSQTLKKEINLPFTKQKYPFLNEYSKDSLVLYFFKGGHYVLSGSPLDTSNITNYNHESFGITEFYYQNNKNAAYLAVEKCGDICWNFKVIHFDGSVDNIQEFDVDDLNPNDLVGYADHIFFTSNGPTAKDGKFYHIDFTKKSIDIFYSFNQSFSSNGINPIGIIGSKLYFFGSFDQNLGKELYYINTDISTSTDDEISKQNDSFNFNQVGALFNITCQKDICNDFQLEYFDAAGKLMHTQKIVGNEFYNFNDKLIGLVFIRVTETKTLEQKSFSIFIP